MSDLSLHQSPSKPSGKGTGANSVGSSQKNAPVPQILERGDELELVSSEVISAEPGMGIGVEVEKARAIHEVQDQIIAAKRWPRDETASELRISNACRRTGLAKVAFFRYPRGGKQLEGESIRLAEVYFQAWGNLAGGFNEIERQKGRSLVLSFCWDLETNAMVSRRVWVEHAIMLQGGKMKYLTDPRDIYEKVANEAQRRFRACVLQIIPVDVREKAKMLCKKTALDGIKARPLIDQVKEMVIGFSDFGVSADNLSERLGHAVDACNAEEILDMKEIFNALNEKHGKREDYFKIDSLRTEGGKAGELNKLMGEKPKVDQFFEEGK